MDDSDLLIHAGFSTAKMEAETRKVIAKYEEAAKRSAKKFDAAMAKVSNNEALKATAREVDRLSRKYDPLYAASKKYERGVKELNRAVQIGSIGNEEYEKGLERLIDDLERGGKGMGQFGKQVAQTGFTPAQRQQMKNLAFQLNQIGQQGAVTGNYLGALSIQLPDILASFGFLGIMLGGLSAVAGPALIAMFQGASGEAKSLEEQMDALTEVTNAYVAAAEVAATPIETLREKYGDLADEISSVNQQVALFAQAGAEVQTELSVKGLSQSFGGLSRTEMVPLDTSRGFWASMFDKGPIGLVPQIDNTMLTMAEELDIGREKAIALALAFERLDTADGVEAQVAALENLLSTFNDVAGSPQQANEMFGDQIKQAEGLLENLSKQREASLSEEERRIEQLFNTYTERTREMAKLTEDRALAEQELWKAQAAGDLDRIETARQVVSGIDDEIERLTDAKGRVTDLSAEAEILMQAMERLAFDPEDEMLKQTQDFYAAVQQALSDVDNLDDADLSGLESRMRLLREVIDDIRNAVRGVDGDLSVAAQNAYAEYGRSRVAGERLRRNNVSGSAIETIKQFEGFRSTPYWDVNAYRAGFGSDTVTLSDGTVQRVVQGMTVSYADANRDLLRRVGEFQDGIIGQIGRDRFSGFSEEQQAALTSIAYNYGSLPDRILPAVRGGTNQDIATAIARLQSDNDGVNRNRRLQEASAFGSTTLVREEIRQGSERQRQLEQEARERERLLGIRTDYAELMRTQIADAEFENSLIGKSAEEQVRLRAEYLLTQEAKRRGIDLNEKIAGTEETYAEAIRRTAAAMAEQAVSEEQLNAARDQAKQKTEFLANAQKTLEDGLIDAIVEGKNFADVLGNVAKMLAKAALQAALFGTGPFAGSSGGGGLLGGLFGGLFGGGGLLSFDGGGFTGPGSRSGGVDGKGGFPAILHPNETVLDHTRGAQGGGGTFAPQTSIVVQGNADERTLAMMKAELDKRDRDFARRWQFAHKEYNARIA